MQIQWWEYVGGTVAIQAMTILAMAWAMHIMLHVGDDDDTSKP
jgi:hypothetical protein